MTPAQVSAEGSQLHGWKPAEMLRGVAARKLSKVCPVTRAEFDEAAEETRAKATTPGLGYWASTVETNRKARAAPPVNVGIPSDFDPNDYLET